ncbi:protein kinase domain-containing protein [Gimesia maris]|uniref:Serine/threonine-protein kinase PknB n=1 Tax=Gimesia maris TaxID=122 RepID=A0ABX5YJW2_9PLAN|nr:LamG-like jellyroll fold domain-containing protein [Gimesia maris]QEG15978.1 Serine/threonine-protein kinase PknB [Gimesia maris]QGQ30763.1 protein kinase [Gimesia maris]
MSITLEKFISQLDESGVISAVEITAFQQSQSPAAESAEELGKLLVKHKKVTKLQVQLVYQGKGDRLLLGNYLILDKIGAGGMGDVYLAEHRRMERQVALKTLPAAMTRDTQSILRFHREVKAAAKLTHPNIVAAYDADEANGVHYFVMEYVEGIDLSAVVKKQGVLEVDVAVDYILQAAKGLEFAHNKGVIHRDIKPANMLLDNDGTIKILDMGLARIEDEAHEIPATQLTQDGSVMGTVDYMAPEQAKDTHTADARSDIYSLGCSLYYLLTGESVYRGSTMVNRIMAHQNDPIPTLTGKHILISQDVDAVFQKMVAKKPEDRFQSMSEVIVAIDNCIQMKSSSTVATEPSDPELHKFLQSQRMASSPTVVMSADAMKAEKPLTDTQNESLTSGFLNHTLGGTSYQPLAKRKQSIGKRGGIIAGVVLASLILIAGIVLKVDTAAGTIILEVDQPELAGAVVSVDEQQKITIKTGKGTEPIEVVADEKTHTLQVTKGGFETFTKQFIVKAGGKETIKVRLEPLAVAEKIPPSQNSNYALEFDGKTNYVAVNLPKYTANHPLTLEAFIIPRDSRNSKWPDSPVGLARLPLNLNVKLVKGRVKLEIYVENDQNKKDRYAEFLRTEYIPIPSEGFHAAVCYDGKRLSLFLNGKKLNTTRMKRNTDGSYSETDGEINLKEFYPGESFFIGCHRDGAEFFPGIVDEVRISNVARYTKDFTPENRFESDEHTMALYHFDEGTGDVLKDSSGNGHDGKIVGAKWVKVDDELQVRMVPFAVAEKKMPSAGTPAKSHSALRFQNRSDHVALPLKHETAGDLTVEAWVTIDENSNQPSTYITNVKEGHGLFLSLASSRGDNQQWGSTILNNGEFRLMPSHSKVEIGKRTNIAVTYKGNVAQIYVNGHKKGKMNFKELDILTDGPFSIGWVSNQNFKGSIDEVRFSNTARYSEDFTPTDHFENDKNTLALYHFDEGTGDVLKDSSGNGHDGKIVGAKWVEVEDELQGSMVPLAVAEKKMPSAGTPAKSHSALRFQNDSDRVVLPLKHETAGDLTVEAWVTIDENSNRPLRFIANGSSLTSFGIGYSKAEGKEKEWSTSVSNNGQFQVLQTNSKVEFGKRTNITVTYKGNVAQIYVNGHKKGEMNFTGSNIHTDEFITIGNRYKGPPIKGSIDEVRFSNIARYTEDFTPTDHFETDKNTLALYHFDEGSGDILKDASGNGHDGKIVGAKWVKVDDELQVTEPSTASEKPMTEREVAEWVIGMGGWVNTGGKSITKIEQLPTEPFVINFLDLKGTSVKDDDLKRLAGLKTLPKLNLENTLVSDTGLQYLKDIPLNYISLIGTQITDKGFGYLSNMPSLTTLYVGSTAISNSGVEQLKDMKQLEKLSFTNTQIDGVGLGHLKDLKNLKILGLESTSISDVDLQHLHGLKILIVLGLSNCKIADSGLAYLKDLKNLKVLSLDSTPITDEGLKHLSGLKMLQTLELQKTKVTPQGIASLQKALPNCKIVSDFETKPIMTSDSPMTDREIAEWVIGMGGGIGIGFKLNYKIEELPTEPVIFNSVSLKNASFEDHDLQRLAKLKTLKYLFLESTSISDTGLQYLRQMQNLEEIFLDYTNITDEGLLHLRGLQNLRVLRLSKTKITGEGLGHLKDLPRLHTIDVNRAAITNSGMKAMGDLKQLTSLNISFNSQVDDTGLGYIEGLTKLEKLFAHLVPKITDEGLKHLQGMKQLESLTLSSTGITTTGLEQLTKHESLSKLDLTNCKITDSGLEHLQDLKNLRDLRLDLTPVSDAGLQHLYSLKKLENLDLRETKVTSQGIADLQKALPKCKIESDFKTKPPAMKAP